MRINIITINLNNKSGLERTIKSVLNQTVFNNIDYIIIDGGSTDGSTELINECKEKLFYYCSEKDNGIFNAMNKGIDHVNDDAEYILFLNSGDFLHSDTVIEEIIDKLDTDIVYGNEIMFKMNDSMVNYSNYHFASENLSTYPDVLDEKFFKVNALPHQSTFIRTKLHKERKYDESCVIAGDWKFTRESIMKYGCSYKHLPTIISHYGLDGISSKRFHVFLNEKKQYYDKLGIK